MNTQEFAEWLRKEIHTFSEDLQNLVAQEAERGTIEWASGYVCALMKAKGKLGDLTSLDSSHDLPSEVATTSTNAS